MEIFRTIEACRAARKQWGDETVALIPTMGALHHGHLSLIEMGKEKAQRIVVSIFVNPIQFRPNEDFTRYPRPVEDDLAMCRDLGIDGVFLPSVEEIYPDGRSDLTLVTPPDYLIRQLCGLSRPGHFEGVATVVLKLFNIIQPDIAIFGEKDAQQLAVIRQMVKDLNVPVSILSHPTVREESGLAVSSRNRYLKSREEWEAAKIVSSILLTVRQEANKSENVSPVAREALSSVAEKVLAQQNGLNELFQLEYLSAVDRTTFQPAETLHSNAKVLIAARVGDIRLIDNLDITDTPD